MINSWNFLPTFYILNSVLMWARWLVNTLLYTPILIWQWGALLDIGLLTNTDEERQFTQLFCHVCEILFLSVWVDRHCCSSERILGRWVFLATPTKINAHFLPRVWKWGCKDRLILARGLIRRWELRIGSLSACQPPMARIIDIHFLPLENRRTTKGR